jgi:hypothetical protein
MNNKTPQNYAGAASVDVSLKGIVGSLVALVLMGVLLHFALLGLEALFQRNRPRAGQSMTADQDAAPSFAAPQLQLAPRDDLKAFQAREDRLLNSYGWIDKTAGVVRVPISRAMELLIERGLPVNQSNSTQKTAYDLIKDRSAHR